MLLENPYSFVNKEGVKKNLTEMEYILKSKWQVISLVSFIVSDCV